MTLLARPLTTSLATVLLPLTLLTAPMAFAAGDRDAGNAAWEEILGDKKVSRDPTMNRSVNRVAERVIRAADGDPDEWELAVIQDDTPNAFALPGGKIGVHTGLFKVVENEAQLAAVIAHEVAHVTQEHGQARMNQNALVGIGLGILGAAFDMGEGAQRLAATAATLGLVLPFSRDQETQADEVGLHLMAKAGYDPREAIKVWENFERAGGNGGPEFLNTHPAPGNRGDRLEALLPEVMPIYRKHAQDEERTIRATPRNRGETGDRVTQKGVYDIRDR